MPNDVALSRDVARSLVFAVDTTILDVLRGKLRRVREAYQRLTGARVR
jgi:hypothetical protein